MRRTALYAVVAGVLAVVTVGVTWRGPADPTPTGTLDSVSPLPVRTVSSVGEGLRRQQAAAEHAAQGWVSTPTGSAGRTAEDIALEQQMASDNRARLFEENILGLHAAAAEAEADGRPEQAALMRKRARRLVARFARES